MGVLYIRLHEKDMRGYSVRLHETATAPCGASDIAPSGSCSMILLCEGCSVRLLLHEFGMQDSVP